MPLEGKDLGRLRDMLDWGREAQELSGDLDEDSFSSDRRTYLAVLHCIQIVGEAAWSLSGSAKALAPEIPWPLVASMRHRLVHDYGRIDPTRIFSVLHSGLPELLAATEKLLDQHGASQS